MVQLDSLPLLNHMADTTNTIAEGEVLQLVRAGNPDTTEAQYLDVITRKTAILFAAGCYGAALLAGEAQPRCQALHDFGLNLGIAFQMIDDVLDYEGDPDNMGKNVGDDLTEGKATLPLIHALSVTSGQDHNVIRQAIANKSAANLKQIIAIIQAAGSIDYTRMQAMQYHELAARSLGTLPSSPASDALAQLLAMAVDRNH